MSYLDIAIIGSDRKEHKLSDYKGKKIVLFFYPKDNTPGWKTEAGDFKSHFKALEELNTVILGVSRDSLTSHDKFIAKLELPFVLLSDENEELCKTFEVLKEKNMFGKKVFGIERSTFVIDEEGTIIKEFRKVKAANHADTVVEFIKSL